MKRKRQVIGDWSVDFALGEIVRGDEVRQLQNQQMKLLEYFAAHAGEVLSLDEIMRDAWDGRVVSQSAMYWNINQIRKALDDDREQYIQTVPKRGYRFIADVRPLDEEAHRQVKHGQLVGGAVLVLVLIAGLIVFYPRPEQAQPVTLAVLPFSNMSDAEHEQLADGITEEVLHAIAAIDDIRVTARTSSFYFKNRALDVREIGEMLGVSRIIEGSVRSSDNRLRITVQLIDTADGTHVWSRAYDHAEGDILDIQQDIALQVAAALDVVPSGDEIEALSRFRGSSATALTMRARQVGAGAQFRTSQQFREARDLLREALRLDPAYVPALNELTMNHLMHISILGGPFEEHFQEASRLLKRLEKLQQVDTWQYQMMFAIKTRFELSAWGQTEERVAATEAAYRHAVELHPNGALPLLSYAIFARRLGQQGRAAELLSKAVVLDPLNKGIIGQYARVLSATGQFDEAERQLRILQQIWPDDPQSYTIAAGVLASVGRFDDALINLQRAPYDPGHNSLMFHLRSVNLAMGSHADAIEWISRNQPDAVDTALLAGLNGDWKEAFRQIDVVLRNRLAPQLGINELAGDIAYLAGEYPAAVFYYQGSAVDARPGKLNINQQNHRRVLKHAAALLQTGETEEAMRMLDTIEPWFDSHHRFGYEGYATTRAELLALRGASDEAIDELRAMFDAGWEQLSGPWHDPWFGQESPFFAGLRSHPDYVMLQTRADAALEHQRERAFKARNDAVESRRDIMLVAGELTRQ